MQNYIQETRDDKLSQVRQRINSRFYDCEGVLLTTAEKLLPVLMNDAPVTADLSGEVEAEELERWDLCN